MHAYTGCIPDEQDNNDYIYEEFQKATPANETYDTTQWLPPVTNQDEGDCTMQAVTASEAAQRKRIFGDNGILAIKFGYYLQRAVDGNEKLDIGGSIRGACKTTQKYGLPYDSLFPYMKFDFDDVPPINAVVDAGRKRIAGYYRVTSYEGILDALKRGCPVPFNTDIWAWRIGEKGKVTNAHEWKKFDSTNHAMCIVAYYPSMRFDIKRPAFKIRQSWGESEGDRGYYYVPSEILWERGTLDVWVPVVTFKEQDEPNNSYEEITGQVNTPAEDSRFRHVAFVGAWQDPTKCDSMVKELRNAGFPAIKKYFKVFE
jgi:hypothetical protein